MQGLKISGVFAACGFVLSFFAGLFSHTSILSVLLKALIFALVFGLLGFGISFVFRTFLSDGISGDLQSDTSEGVSTAAVQNNGLGQNVDITIQDEELQKSESDNHFVVGENHQMLNDSDVKNVSNPAATASSSSGFVPLRNFETVNNFSGKEAESPVIKASESNSHSANAGTTPAPSQPVPDFSGAEDGELDTLPDMGNFTFGESDSASNDDDDDVPASGSDSEFVSVSSSKKTEEPEVKDAALMAKAISSVLSDENSL